MTGDPRTDLTRLLDGLETAHAQATPGPWSNPRPFTKLIDAPGRTDNLAIVQCDHAADAALIVAAVNALGPLLAAVRAGLALADAAANQRAAEELRGFASRMADVGGHSWLPVTEANARAAALAQPAEGTGQ